MKVSLVNLANNHVMDHGAAGLKNTLDVCHREGIGCVGGGNDVTAASQLWFCERNGVRLAVLSCAEHEFGMATPARAGANPLDLVRIVRGIREQRKNFDRLVILLHGGNEYCPYPRPSLAELCRFLVEQGADAVICQHSHCIGCWENHQGGIIVHGQGNFIFDDPKARPCEKEGLLLSLEVSHDQPLAMRMIFFKQAAGRPGIEPMSEAEEARARQLLDERNARLQDAGFLEREWVNFCSGKRRAYLGIVHGFGRRLRNLDTRFGVLSPFFSKRHALMMLHMLRCESHRELMEQVLSDETKAQ
ncbi:MAG: CapA family protein [Akkermansiaceae bacterium]|nr:CapA family protein [Verrucomicrobiales bacterium]